MESWIVSSGAVPAQPPLFSVVLVGNDTPRGFWRQPQSTLDDEPLVLGLQLITMCAPQANRTPHRGGDEGKRLHHAPRKTRASTNG